MSVTDCARMAHHDTPEDYILVEMLQLSPAEINSMTAQERTEAIGNTVLEQAIYDEALYRKYFREEIQMLQKTHRMMAVQDILKIVIFKMENSKVLIK